MNKGLTTTHAQELLHHYGHNVISDQQKHTTLTIFLNQFKSVVVLLLIGSSLASFFIGETTNSLMILAVVILNALFGFYQEFKAGKTLEALKNITVSMTRVIRDGVEKEIDSRFLVPGDLIVLNEGCKIPADAHLLEALNMEVNEAALTGESLPVFKNKDEEIFMGTMVVRGRGLAQIDKTGMSTLFGQVALQTFSVKTATAPLEKKFRSLYQALGFIGIAAAVVVFLLSFLAGNTRYDSFLLAIALAVAVIPEGLPAVLTVTLSLGVKEMAKKKVILRKLSAIEALGSVTLIATDKTGTLTTNEMQVKHLYLDHKQFNVGVGFSDPVTGGNTPPLQKNNSFSLLVLNSILCSTTSLVEVHGEKKNDVLGDPTEGSLLKMVKNLGLQPEMIKNEWRLLHEIPFDSTTKRMSVVVQNVGAGLVPARIGRPQESPLQKNNETFVFTKGSPESILSICSKIMIDNRTEVLTSAEKSRLEKQVEEWGEKGLRVLAFCYKDGKKQLLNCSIAKLLTTPNPQNNNSTIQQFNNDFIFLGLAAIHDAPRPEAAAAVEAAHAKGIKVVMITGDNEKTAESIATHVDIMQKGDEVLTGKQLDEFTDEELLEKLDRVKVFARTTPLHKHCIVKLFQQKGEIVAVTGDGINDAIALKQADVGIAMGRDGTDVARETADMVITDDNFATIIVAIEEGRQIIKNIKKSLKYLFSGNISEAAVLIVSLFLGIPALFSAIQILYINLVTDTLPALALAFNHRTSSNPSSPSYPSNPSSPASLLSHKDLSYVALVSVVMTAFILIAYYFYSSLFNTDVGKTAAFTVLILGQAFVFIDIWFGRRRLFANKNNCHAELGSASDFIKIRSRNKFGMTQNWLFIVAILFSFLAQYFVVTVPHFSRIFKISHVSPALYVVFIMLSAMILPLMRLTRRKHI